MQSNSSFVKSFYALGWLQLILNKHFIHNFDNKLLWFLRDDKYIEHKYKLMLTLKIFLFV